MTLNRQYIITHTAFTNTYFKERGLRLSDRALGSAQSDWVTFNAGIWTRQYHVVGLCRWAELVSILQKRSRCIIRLLSLFFVKIWDVFVLITLIPCNVALLLIFTPTWMARFLSIHVRNTLTVTLTVA